MPVPSRPMLSRALLALALLPAAAAQADPITISNAGYWLETLGDNTLGLPGSPSGTVTTLFTANTTPSEAQGTSASATINGISVSAPTTTAADPLLWARRVANPSDFQLRPLTVTFANGVDSASFTGQDLRGVQAMPLVESLTVDGSTDPLGPVIHWSLPANAGDIDRVQLVFYSDATNLEIGSRVTLPATATSFDLAGPLPAGFALTVNVRLYDLANDAGPFDAGNVLRASRAYVNYSVPVPEPTTALMLLAGLGLLGLRRWRSA